MSATSASRRLAAALASLMLAVAAVAQQAAPPIVTAPAVPRASGAPVARGANAAAASPQAPAPTPVEPGSSSPPAVATKGAIAAEVNPDWASTLERIASSVVSIEVDSTRAFDTEWNSSSQATGFVVDAERGLILTNRHVVTPGPVTAEATFLNREEVPIHPVYRDPVHDFGLYRYDPSKLKFIKPKALPLFPEGAQIGREIRVVGNNAGEQLSILAGTLAKLDRDAPQYGVGKYNDFNTFYLQAASGTSGGSSGSPVIDIRGRVVALNAGGATGSASSFYLPLARVKRALDLILQDKPVSRGTLRTVFEYTPYDELRRLGLQGDTEAAVRKAFPSNVGMLVVNEVLPGSPTAGVLQPGDILTRVNGKYVTTFEPLEQVLDDTVGGEIAVEWERGGKPMSAKLQVTDLHAITPSAYLEVGDAILNDLSYQQARHFNRPVRGVYVANPGYMLAIAGVPRGAVITQVSGRNVDNIGDMEAALGQLGDGDFTAVRFFTLDDPNGSQLRSVRMTRLWFAARRCDRDDESGLWPCRDLAPGPAPKPPAPGATMFTKVADPQVARIAPSLVVVNFDMPYSVSGVTERSYHGTGLVVDAARGLVVVDRNTVPVSLGDVRITFAGTLQVPGRVVFVHPQHNLAVVAYDPKLIGDTPVRTATLAKGELASGDDVRVVGLSTTSEIKSRATQVAAVDPLVLPLSRTMRFRDANIEVAQLVNPPADFDGVLIDRSGAVTALWSSFAFENGREVAQDNRAVPIGLVSEMLGLVQSGQPLRSLEVEMLPQPLSKSRELGLSDEWLKKLEQHNPARRQALAIVRIVGGAPVKGVLQQGDLLLAIDDQVVSRFREVERAVAGKETVRATVWRGDSAKTLEVRTAALSGSDIDRIVLWGGATLQAPHRAMSAQRSIPPVGVYVGYFSYGSPATRYGLYPTRRIVEVDGVPTPDLDAFLKAVTGKPDRASVRLRTLTWNDAPEVITLKLDKHYWPAYELVRTPGGWERRALE